VNRRVEAQESAHPHDERRWLEPGVPVECDVEIWPTSMV